MKNTLSAFLLLFALAAQAQNNFKVPTYEKFKLKNGLTVYLMEQHEVPLIYTSAVFDAGSTQDGDRYGLASMTADALLFGTKNTPKHKSRKPPTTWGPTSAAARAKKTPGSVCLLPQRMPTRCSTFCRRCW